jgi:type IV secretory pathway ATPase VirB11/archaellum biosynthesis ATPase
MIVLGETGAGKTTLLTALKDFIRNRDFEQRTQIIKENQYGLS